MKIRKGEYEYENLLSEAEELISNLDSIYETTFIPSKVDDAFIAELLFNVRKIHYGLE